MMFFAAILCLLGVGAFEPGQYGIAIGFWVFAVVTAINGVKK